MVPIINYPSVYAESKAILYTYAANNNIYIDYSFTSNFMYKLLHLNNAHPTPIATFVSILNFYVSK